MASPASSGGFQPELSSAGVFLVLRRMRAPLIVADHHLRRQRAGTVAHPRRGRAGTPRPHGTVRVLLLHPLHRHHHAFG